MKRLLPACLAAVAVVAGVTPAAAHGYKKNGIEIFHPWLAETSGPQAVISMRIKNKGSTADRLVSVQPAQPASARLQGSPPGESIEIPAGTEIVLSSKGPHVVIEGLTRALHAYDRVPLELSFERAGKIEIEATVEEAH